MKRMFSYTDAQYEAEPAVDTDWAVEFDRIESEAAEERLARRLARGR